MKTELSKDISREIASVYSVTIFLCIWVSIKKCIIGHATTEEMSYKYYYYSGGLLSGERREIFQGTGGTYMRIGILSK